MNEDTSIMLLNKLIDLSSVDKPFVIKGSGESACFEICVGESRYVFTGPFTTEMLLNAVIYIQSHKAIQEGWYK